MMIMPANHSSPPVHYWAGKYPGKIGWLVGPRAAAKTKLRPWMPYALDNDAFSAWQGGKPWNEYLWRQLLAWANMHPWKPIWAVVPDVVADKNATIQNWYRYSADVPFPKAFAVQDGMTPGDVPAGAEVVFVGGTFEWKWKTLRTWTENFPRVHVGRVSEIDALWKCEDAGVESCDSTSWFRESDDGRKMRLLSDWIEGTRPPKPAYMQASLI